VGFAYDLFRAALRAANRLVGSPLTYSQDGLYTIHNADFLRDPRFVAANAQAVATDHGLGPNLHLEWRIYVCCWAAAHALRHPGDFVECGVHSGIYSRAAVEYVQFEKAADRKFYLLDTFEALPADQLLPEEVEIGVSEHYKYRDVLASARTTFAPYPNVELVPGRVPETLARVPSTQIAYLSIDMNAVVPEIAAAEYFWDKLVPGAVVVLDDYGWRRHIAQKRGFDRFAAERGVSVLSLPTGQGLIFKS